MSNYLRIVDIKEGQAYIATKSRWLYVFPMPYTSVMPYPCSVADLKRLGVIIKWTTDDPEVLATLHESIVRLLQEVGISGLIEIAECVKMTERLQKTLGGAAPGLQGIIETAAQDGVTLPIPAVVLKYLKRFQ